MSIKHNEKVRFQQITTPQRRQLMSRIKSCNTRPERKLRALLRAAYPRHLKIKFNESALPGKPDAYIGAWKLAIFVDGCFFHFCPQHGHLPKSNSDYWSKKLIGNKRRDARHSRTLRKLGFVVVRLWEHELHSMDESALRRRIGRLLGRKKFLDRSSCH
ncbi:MAG: very short patch repair endonuclease [Terriglobales bacterium]